MQLFVKWDDTNSKVVKGPQAVRPLGDGWYPYVQDGEILDPRSQRLVTRLDERTQTVLGFVVGAPVSDFRRDRAAHYPSLRDQLDALWHDIDDGRLDKTGQFYRLIAAVKKAVPKV